MIVDTADQSETVTIGIHLVQQLIGAQGASILSATASAQARAAWHAEISPEHNNASDHCIIILSTPHQCYSLSAQGQRLGAARQEAFLADARLESTRQALPKTSCLCIA